MKLKSGSKSNLIPISLYSQISALIPSLPPSFSITSGSPNKLSASSFYDPNFNISNPWRGSIFIRQKRVRAGGRICKMYSDNNILLSRRNGVDCLIATSTIKYLGASSHNCIPQPLFLCRAK
jgi:hypothetical protein